MHKRFSRGFTIVELLIVIVVIGILVSVTVVSYRSTRERANDSAVQTDLTKLSDAINVYYSDNIKYPFDQTSFMTITTVQVSTPNYRTSANAMVYCASDASAQSMAIVARSNSGKTYYVKDDAPVKLSAVALSANPTTACTDVGMTGTVAVWVHTTGSGWLSNVL